MNNVLLVVSITLVFGAAQAMAEDIQCNPVAVSAEETLFAPATGTKAAANAPQQSFAKQVDAAGATIAANDNAAAHHAKAASPPTGGFKTTSRVEQPGGSPATPHLSAANWGVPPLQKSAISALTAFNAINAHTSALSSSIAQINAVSKQLNSGTYNFNAAYAAIHQQVLEQEVLGYGGGGGKSFAGLAMNGSQLGPNDAPVHHDVGGNGEKSGAGVVAPGSAGGVLAGLPKGGTSITVAPELQGGILAGQLGHDDLTPGQQSMLNAILADDPTGKDCTQNVFIGMYGAASHLDQKFGGEAQNRVDEEEDWQKYLANPHGYSDSVKAPLFADAASATGTLLHKCFRPASTSPAYRELDIPRRLGFIWFGTTRVCEALLLSSDHILTARHCWFASGNNMPQNAFKDGTAYFTQSGNATRRYQICAAETRATGTSASLQKMSEEQVVMRIAPGSDSPPPVEVMSPADIKAFPSEQSPPANAPVTRTVVFALIEHSEKIDASYTGDLAVGSVPCFVMAYDATNQCFTNMCATYERTSGGPVFGQTASGKWKLLGIHLGASNPDDHLYPACTSKASQVTNAALVPDATLLAKFSTKGP